MVLQAVGGADPEMTCIVGEYPFESNTAAVVHQHPFGPATLCGERVCILEFMEDFGQLYVCFIFF